MLARVLVGAIAAGMAWKYRDSIRAYVKGNAGPAREQIDRFVRTVQDKSRVLFDPATSPRSSRSPSTPDKVSVGAAEEGRPTE
jgi:hypothetical protein